MGYAWETDRFVSVIGQRNETGTIYDKSRVGLKNAYASDALLTNVNHSVTCIFAMDERAA